MKVLIIKSDNYGGKLIGYIWTFDGLSINQYMLDAGFAANYDKKLKWTSKMLEGDILYTPLIIPQIPK